MEDRGSSMQTALTCSVTLTPAGDGGGFMSRSVKSECFYGYRKVMETLHHGLDN